MQDFIRTSGIYKGIVVNTEDPGGLNRIQIRIPEIHGMMDKNSYKNLKNRIAVDVLWVNDDDLPWAQVCYPFGETTSPEINQVVWIMFYAGNENFPVIIGWTGYDYTSKEEPFELKE